ncbi:MAG: endonuclease/exonuclease/phosphatase family protein [Bacteroidaceae bacterium]
MIRKCLMALVAICLPLLSNAKDKVQEPVKVRWCTFNIRCISSDDEKIGCGWDSRKAHVAQYVLDNKIDVVGMQEVTFKQLQDIRERLQDYDYVGVGRTDGKEKGEFTPVFFRKEKYEALERGNFWLSETPEVPGSKGWDAALERVASYVKLKDKATGRIFMAINTHYDHVGVVARKESAKLIMKKIQDIVGDNPAVVTGDFNIEESDEAYITMVSSDFKMNDAYHMTARHTGVPYTFHNFCRVSPLKAPKIDFIFITPGVRVIQSHIERENPNHQLSDHNPHWADLEF